MITYAPFWATLEARGKTQTELIKAGVSPTTLQKLRHDRSMGLSTLDQLCQLLDCEIQDIVTLIRSADADQA